MEAQMSYGPIQPTSDYLEQLHHHVHPQRDLKKAGYIFAELSPVELQRKERCSRCCKALKKERRRNLPDKPNTQSAPNFGKAGPNDAVTRSQLGVHIKQASDTTVGEMKRTQKGSSADSPLICRYHDGRVANRRWTCCNGALFSNPCAGQKEHSPRHYSTGELEKNWQFHETRTEALPTHVAAVVLDCEMGTASTGESELIRLSMVDFFTGATLIDSLVYPSVKMTHYNTRFSGVTKQAMEDSRRRRQCIIGRDSARQAVYKFVGPETVVIGHAGHQDLTSLRWTHHRVVDTLMLETRKRSLEADMAEHKRWEEAEKADGAEAASPAVNADEQDNITAPSAQEGGLSLKALALTRLNRVIQVKGRGHNSLEDALATRDLLHWHIRNTLESTAEGLW
ncbi:hypothetical protein ED733_007302 [Metarhizium rileyi]|uniref:Exonuclease domain-containing protein n=1 Tax=Metarhizium rileyi (strain RCEF 4871) TaxID=1649241 RepID=A0A5C6GKI2_METRR|nr:hypothetical protein ED733_007302 [Metarhizium rileyi]